MAGLIQSLQLEQNQITLILSNFLDEGGDGGSDDDEAMTRPATKVRFWSVVVCLIQVRGWRRVEEDEAMTSMVCF